MRVGLKSLTLAFVIVTTGELYQRLECNDDKWKAQQKSNEKSATNLGSRCHILDEILGNKSRRCLHGLDDFVLAIVAS
jgi:hypothetical protein